MRTVTEEKSIAKLFPELLVEWDFSKNATLISPTEVSKGSNLKVWWICPENHSYEKSIKIKMYLRDAHIVLIKKQIEKIVYKLFILM